VDAADKAMANHLKWVAECYWKAVAAKSK